MSDTGGAVRDRGGAANRPLRTGTSLEERVEGFLSAEGPLAERKPGYRARPQQIGYARAVARAIEVGVPPPVADAETAPLEPAPPSLLLADCPTGTGKTLASLVSIALAGKRAVYSTATINLQSQLINSELPLISRVLGADSGFSYALLKGRANYVCDNRLDAAFRGQGPGRRPAPEELSALGAWRASTRTGERDDFPGPASLWPRLAADPHDCAPTTCRFREACFYLSSARSAKDAQILVVNHALLAANLVGRGAIFPLEDRVLVVDEAHRLRESLSAAYGVHLTLARMLQVARAARAKGTPRVARAADAVEWAAERFFGELDLVLPGSVEDESTLPDPDALDGALSSLRAALGAGSGEGARGTASMARQLLRDLRSFYRGRERFARAVTVAGAAGRRAELRSWLVDVGPAFAWDLADRGRPRKGSENAADGADTSGDKPDGPVTVLCSATLATGSGPKASFTHARRELGVGLLLKTRPGTVVAEHRAEEAFDYERRALVYLERGLPEPSRDNAETYARLCASRTAEILALSRGRALVLLSTARAVRLFREHLKVPYPVRYGVDEPTGPLVAWLKETPNAVLVGTRSLWEGVDVAGPQVSCVIIDKVPFTAPDDPVNKALVERAGPDWFRLVSLPAAQVALRQGAGRLVRSASDRGVLALLDPRVSSRRWGGHIVSCLPPAPTTTSLESVRRFFEGE